MTEDQKGRNSCGVPQESPGQDAAAPPQENMASRPSPGALLLLRNLLDRLDADAQADRPQLRGIVSDAEREALRQLLGAWDGAVAQVGTQTERAAATPAERAGETPSPAIELRSDALQLDASPAPDWVLCLDFGTAKSKAFAATQDEEEPDFEPLPIGLADEDRDQAVYEVASCVWIDDDGLLFVGSEAVERSMNYGGDRQALVSLKQRISLVDAEDGAAELERFLSKEEDPSSTLTYADAITIYLSYLTDLATTALEKRGKTRYVCRRFTVPAWRESQRRWAAEWIGTRILRAQLLADTFHGCWRDGIPVEQVKAAVRAAAKYDGQLDWMATTAQRDSSDWRHGTLEALAASSGRLWTDDAARHLMLVVDVGAGTTDLSLFWVVQDQGKSRRAWPIEDGFVDGIRQAGDQLDDCLVEEMMKKAGLGMDGTGALARRALRRAGVRGLKETLFLSGRVTEVLVNDETVTLNRDEFIQSERVRAFSETIAVTIQKLLDRVHASWQRAADDGFTMVLTGGGCDLPMITNLANRQWRLGDGTVRVRLASRVPDFVADRFNQEFVQEYPRLAVAMGGALNMRLDEKNALPEWMGGASTPGRLEQFPTKGI